MRAQQKFNHHPTKQAGVITILAVLMMLSLFTFVAVVADTGRLYLEKRSLQKNADLAAMETALIYCRDQSLDVEAMSMADMYVLSASRNDFKGNDTNSSIAISRTGNAVTVNLVHTVPASLFAQLLPSEDNEISLSATATAKACEPTAQIAIRSNLISINSQQSSLLNAVLGDILGGTLNLNIAAWQGLLNTNVNLLDLLDALSISLGISAGDYDSVLTTALSVGTLLDLTATVLDNSGATTVATSVEDISSLVPGDFDSIALGDLLKIGDDLPAAALDVPINVLNLVQGGLQLANENSFVALNQAVNVFGLLSGEMGIKIIEAAQFSGIGNPDFDDITARTSQADIFISLRSSLLNGLGLASISPLPAQIDVIVKAATANASIVNESQNCDGGPSSINSNTNTSAATIQIGRIGNTPAASRANFAAGGYTLNRTPIANITVLGIPIFRLEMKATLTVASGTTFINHEQSPSEEYLPEIKDGIGENAYSPTGTNLGNVLGLQIDLNPVLIGIIPLGFVLNPILNSVTAVLDGVLSALLIPIINPLLNSLGTSLAGANVGAALTCENDKVRLVN